VRRAATLVALLAAISALAVPTALGESAPSAADLEAELVCPTCKTTLDQSDAPIARRMKAIIRERIAAGASATQIKAELVDQFGPAVLAEPPKRGFDLLAWLLPLVGIAVGAVGVGALAWVWSRRRREDDPSDEPPLDPELDRRVDDALAGFDA
jgi:cytochrome c-type biogenesis protein CcmH